MKIITLGPIGTFSYYLTAEEFPSAHIDCVPSIEAIFEHIDAYDKAVIPLENDVSGFVEQSIDHLMTCQFATEQLIELPIKYNLVGFGSLSNIHTLFVFPHSYKQCLNTVKNLLPKVEVIYTSSNGMSAEKLRHAKSEGYAAIIPSYTGVSTEFPILQQEIQDCSTNTTRFLVLTKQQHKQSGIFACFLFSRKQQIPFQKDLDQKGIAVKMIKETPMEGIDCHCYFAVIDSPISLLEGYDIKILGYLNENR